VVRPGDIVCFSQLRWDFVTQRPHHLMQRAALERRVWYVEEAATGRRAKLRIQRRGERLWVIRPVVPHGVEGDEADAIVATMLAEHAAAASIRNPIAWFWTPLSLPWAAGLASSVVVYDCMDDLTAFRNAPRLLREREASLLQAADVVFTGGASLYRAKRDRHPNVHVFPSAVDVEHFARARQPTVEPEDQAGIPRPRIGWFGVIDERMDLDLIRGVAERRPDWSLVLIGPIVKINPASIPRRPNVHLMGARPYSDLPAYLAGWDVAMMPFARNDATRFISPTKTPEYLAAGRPVVSTSIADVVEPYGRLGLVRIADDPASFVHAVEAAMAAKAGPRHAQVDAFLADRTWDRTWAAMSALIDDALAKGEAQPSTVGSSSREDAGPPYSSVTLLG
jgi:glycosyltransferase involved in cell wall biosynthesis